MTEWEFEWPCERHNEFVEDCIACLRWNAERRDESQETRSTKAAPDGR